MKKMLAVTLAVLRAGIVAGCGTKTDHLRRQKLKQLL